jgi:hypothetical protein
MNSLVVRSGFATIYVPAQQASKNANQPWLPGDKVILPEKW